MEFWKIKVDKTHPLFGKFLIEIMKSSRDSEESFTSWEYIGKDESFEDDGEYNAWNESTNIALHNFIPLISIEEACKLLEI